MPPAILFEVQRMSFITKYFIDYEFNERCIFKPHPEISNIK